MRPSSQELPRLLLILLLVSSLASSIYASSIPTFSYRYAAFATTAPDEAAAFLVEYTGARLLNPSEYLLPSGGNATVQGLRWCYGGSNTTTTATTTSCHDAYFINDPSKPSGGRPIQEYAGMLSRVHRFEVQETWDWYQDWHLCVKVDDVDDLLHRLLRDKVPLVTRSLYSFYVQIPGSGLTLQVLGSTMAYVWTEEFNFCRYTNGEGIADGDPRQPRLLEELPAEAPAFPEVRPGHMSFFSTQPLAAFNYTLLHSSATPYNMTATFQDTHRYGDGACAQLAWVQFGGGGGDGSDDGGGGDGESSAFQVHYIQQFHKHSGPQDVPSTERFLEGLHSATLADGGYVDAYMDYRVGFSVGDLAAFARHLDDSGIPYIPVAADGTPLAAKRAAEGASTGGGSSRGGGGKKKSASGGADDPATAMMASLLYQIPGGVIFEVLAE